MTGRRNNPSPVNTLTICSIMAAITALLQLSAVFVPAAGHVLSAFCTLPVAIATVVRPVGGIAATVVAALIIGLVQPLEIPVLLLTAAPLGWLLAIGLVTGRNRWFSIAASSTVFFTGSALLTYFAGQLVFGGAIGSSVFYRLLVLNALFSLFYTIVWEIFIRQTLARLALFFPYLRV